MAPRATLPDSAALDAEWRRCRHEGRRLALLELSQTVVAVGVLVVVALCGVAAITHTAVASGDLALPLGLGLAISVALAILGFAFRVRMSREVLSQELFRLDCARRNAAERATAGDSHPYRVAPSAEGASCTRCRSIRLRSI